MLAFTMLPPSQVNQVVCSSARKSMNLKQLRSATFQEGIEDLMPKTDGLGIRSDHAAPTRSINTRLWDALNGYARQQVDGPASESGSSRIPSTTVQSLTNGRRPSPTRVMQQTAHLARSMGPPVNIPQPYMNISGADEYSATEVATPSAQGTPDMRNFIPPTAPLARSAPADVSTLRRRAAPSPCLPVQASIEKPQPSTPEKPQQRPSQISGRREFSRQEVADLLQAYGHRIDVLENLSFSHVPVDEIQDKFENFDGRLLDLEHWRSDYERERENEQASVESSKQENSKKRRLLPTESGSFASDGSFDSAAAAQTEAAVLATLAANAETVPRIEALENRMTDLENDAMPSFTRPWQVQVVLLPWGSDLHGIWFSAMDATNHSMKSSQQASDEWSGAQSLPKLSFQSATAGAWTTESIQAWANETEEWLSPKACGPNGMVFQRLASRGLVQDVTFHALDSRHILNTLAAHFEGILPSEALEMSEQMPNYQGFQESFVPLRKVRKSSRLRFLSPSEMITSAIWNASFLDSSVMMKVNDGQRRLYITTPEAYTQSCDNGLSWPSIRRLPLFDATGEEEAAQATSAVIEACWTYNDQLDRPASARSSFTSNEFDSSPPGHGSSYDSMKGISQPISPRSEARTLRYRTMSLPDSSSTGQQSCNPVSKRRVASFESGTTVPVSNREFMEPVSFKKRRISKTPEAEHKGVGFTPRWSREPPSPFTSEPHVEIYSQGAASARRGATPFAYATPHSNTVCVGKPGFLRGDGDTEADTEMGQPQSEHGEEEWHGVEEDRELEDEREAPVSELGEANTSDPLAEGEVQ
ncbi:hypothetical protein D0863_02421 [Hortaea werneckii]|uniref:Uncharacterized protein n=1 Tax=Hortaea werneckii TaxID=91943 RepID=A0A3M7EGR3_HORWE|nr:hypothetical protein D0863_02421 [Hortaea werneckii]